MPRRQPLLIFAAVAVAALTLVDSAGATITYWLAEPNAALSSALAAPPFGFVEVTRNNDTNATVKFVAVDNVDYDYKFGGVNAIALNITGTWTIESINPPPGDNITETGEQNVSGFGTFNCTLKNKDGETLSFKWLELTIAATGETQWLSEHAVLTTNAAGYVAGAHIFAFPTTDSETKTGFVGDGEIPEPASMAVWGLGACLVGLVGNVRRRSAKRN